MKTNKNHSIYLTLLALTLCFVPAIVYADDCVVIDASDYATKANGKNVKYGYLHMRPEYKVKSYDVYHKNYGTSKWIKDGTGTTKKAYSVNIRKTYTYK